MHPDSGLGAHFENLVTPHAHHVDHLLPHHVQLRMREIDFVDDGNDREVALQRQVEIAQGLGFHSLRGIHHQQRPFTGGQTARHLVGKIHMARRVDQIQAVFPVPGARVAHLDGVQLDGDAAVALQFHVIQHLIHHGTLVHRVRHFQQTIGKRGLPVVNMGNNAEIADILLSHQAIQANAPSHWYSQPPFGSKL